VKPGPKTACSFERIYFSRSNDKDIYRERMTLGANLVPLIMDAIDQDLDNAVFSFIPNTAETCFYGLIKEIENEHNRRKIAEIQAMGNTATAAQIEKLLTQRLRIEKVAIKDAKQRTFITQDADRDDMVASVYDITYGTVNPGVDTLVMIDDSIVRGTTLKKSILRILDRLSPKKIVIVSSAPQIRYPDCYGIDMARMGDFIAFQAAVALHEDRGTRGELDVIYKKCKDQEPKEQVKNYVQEVYAPFTTDEINAKISELLRPEGIQAEVQIIYQTLEGLHAACPDHTGDWYFSGNYPTPGGNKVVNRAFVYYMEGRTERAY
jgi:amidophosphoribosyltransferase